MCMCLYAQWDHISIKQKAFEEIFLLLYGLDERISQLTLSSFSTCNKSNGVNFLRRIEGERENENDRVYDIVYSRDGYISAVGASLRILAQVLLGQHLAGDALNGGATFMYIYLYRTFCFSWSLLYFSLFLSSQCIASSSFFPLK